MHSPIYNFIGSNKCRGSDELILDAYNPATNQILARGSSSSEQDIKLAFETSQKAFLTWKNYTPQKRSEILWRASDWLEKKAKDIADIETKNTGKPYLEILSVDIPSGIDALRYMAGILRGHRGAYQPLSVNQFALIQKEPLGVCLGIGAWNYPFQIACWKAAPALACGNSMIFKPSELTPLSTLYLAEALVEAGAPSGTFQVLQGKGDVAEKLLTHPLLKKASLTGSISTGKKVASLCGRKLIPSTLELGGKSPLLILEDADLTKSVEITLMANFYAGGEVCSNGTRVFVPKAKILEFTKLLKKRVEELPLGDPFDKQTLIGSLISKAHKEKVYNYVQRALQEGATLVSGHNLIKLPQALEEGAFYPPTILTDVFDDFEICKEEVFGPVVTLLSYDHEDELVERANKTEGGLGAGIITNNLQKAHRIAQLLQAGIIWVNTYNQTPLEVEFGGMKESGIGRENGLEVLNHYTQTKTIFFDLDEKSLFP